MSYKDSLLLVGGVIDGIPQNGIYSYELKSMWRMSIALAAGCWWGTWVRVGIAMLYSATWVPWFCCTVCCWWLCRGKSKGRWNRYICIIYINLRNHGSLEFLCNQLCMYIILARHVPYIQWSCLYNYILYEWGHDQQPVQWDNLCTWG